MSFWSTLPLVRITMTLMGGILWAYYQPLSANIIGWGMIVTVTCYLVLVAMLALTRSYAYNMWISILGLISIFLSGALCLSKYQIKPNLPLNDIKAYVAVALEDAVQREDRLSVTVAIKQAKVGERWIDVSAQVRLQVANPSTTPIAYGDVYMVLGTPKLIGVPLNPNEFDYQTFLSHENIFYQHRVSSPAMHKIGYKPPNRLQVLLLKMGTFCRAILTHAIKASRERGIVLALVLGVKDEIDVVIKEAYSGAGTLHVLAVSGLHVGILYGLLSLLLRRLRQYKQTQWMSALLVLAGLWVYAGVTGLTPSVLRATFMFSLLVIAKLLRRTGNMYNVLAASAFVLLVCKPTLIFSVSFQLSYLAVGGIVYLQPKIYQWLHVKHFILRQLWLWTSVSLAAQVATTPISLYYFHQFPSYFIVANWVVVPAAFLIFTLGLGVLVTCWWTGLSALIAWVLEQVTWLVNQFVGWVNDLPYSVIANMYLPLPRLLLWYGLLIMLLVFLKRKKFRLLVCAGGCALWLSISTIQEILQRNVRQGVIFYSIPSHQAVGFFKGSHHLLLVDEQLKKEDKKFSYHIQPSQLAMGSHTTNQYTFKEAVDVSEIPMKAWQGGYLAAWENKLIAWIDKPIINCPGVNKKLQIDFLVIEKNSVASLKSLLQQFECTTLIIGSSNTRQQAKQLKLEADEIHLKNHVIGEEGALKVCW